MQDEAYSTIQVGGPRAKLRGKALVDVADAETVGAYSWCMSKGYAVRYVRVGGRRTVFMHREILGLEPGDGHHVDHVNGDTLDNRRANLRIATKSQNGQNLHNRPHRGASWHAGAKRWMASAMLDGKSHYLGLYDTEEEAAAVAAAWRCQHMPYSRDARGDCL